MPGPIDSILLPILKLKKQPELSRRVIGIFATQRACTLMRSAASSLFIRVPGEDSVKRPHDSNQASFLPSFCRVPGPKLVASDTHTQKGKANGESQLEGT